jgi:hypothetical protein
MCLYAVLLVGNKKSNYYQFNSTQRIFYAGYWPIFPKNLQLHLLRQPSNQAGEEIQQQHGQYHEEEHGQRHSCDVGQLPARHALHHKQVEAHRRRDLRHLDHDDDKDAKPDRINARFEHGGHDHAHREHHHADAI